MTAEPSRQSPGEPGYPANVVMPWSAGARAALDALRQVRNSDGYVSVASALVAWIDLPPSGVSAIHAALADGASWSMLSHYRLVVSGSRDAMQGLGPGSSRLLGHWETEAEKLARAGGGLTVAERHVLGVMTNQELRDVGLDGEHLKAAVRDLEIGAARVTPDLMPWNHVALDLSALIEYQRPDQIAWEEVIGAPGVVLWLVASVLNELDETKRHQNQKVADRARERGRWLWDHMATATTPAGAAIRPKGSRLRIWAATSQTPFRDTDHLEAFAELKSIGYPIQIVTDDTLMAARALAIGMPARRLDSSAREPK
ncbi:MAG: PIN domain-containing protein [Candidatus Acidiferrales bacterium]